MAYIFLDESGCLGFSLLKKGTSKNFLITFLFTSNKRPVEKIVKKTFLSLPKSILKSHSGFLHCSKEQPKTRIKLLTLLNQRKDIALMTIRVNKEKIYPDLQNEKRVLYNYITNILLDRIFTKKLISIDQPINLIASKRETNKFLNQNFTHYLENQSNKNHNLSLNIKIHTPNEEKALQAVDFASWALFRFYEYGDEYYYNIIKNLIIEDKPLF